MLAFRNRKLAFWAMSFIMLAATLLFTSTAEGASSKRIEVYTDQQPVKFSIDPLTKNGTTLVQLRPLFESLGIKIIWNAATQTVSGQKEGQSFSLTLNSKTAEINEKNVSLTTPGTTVNGHTMVPLRFVGEATGAVVGWNSQQQTISIYSDEFMKASGLSKAEAQAETNKGVPNKGVPTAPAKGKLRGFYAKWEMDVTGLKGCSTLCWDYYYFINDKQVATEFPDGGIDTLDCSKDKCLDYEMKGNRLVLSNGKSYPFKAISATEVEIDGEKYTQYKPSSGLKLEGKYESTSYTSSPLGSGLATSITYVFRKDGTFFDSKFVGYTTDGSDSGDNSGVSTTTQSEKQTSGTYSIANYTISLKYKDGTTKKVLFFLPEQPNVNMLRIGGRDYLLKEKDGTKGDSDSGSQQAEPFADKLTTEKIAKKQVLFTSNIEKNRQKENIKITLKGYQWAKLTIDPAYKDSITGYGDKGIVALTAKYRIDNDSGQTVNVNSLKVILELPDTDRRILDSISLVPEVKDELKSGEGVERMSVILLPMEYFDNNKDFELAFGPLNNMEGKDMFQEDGLKFYVWKKL